MGYGPCTMCDCDCEVFTYFDESGCDTCGHSFYSHKDFTQSDDGELYMAFERHHNTTVMGLLRSMKSLNTNGKLFSRLEVTINCGCKAFSIKCLDKFEKNNRALKLRLNSNKIVRFGINNTNCVRL